MYDAVTNNLIIREWLNGSLFPLCGNLAFILVVFLAISYTQRGDQRWRDMDGVPTACALAWIFSMETIRAGWIWWILRTTNDGYTVSDAVRIASNYSFVVAAAVLVITILYSTWLWSPPRWRKYFWLYSAVSTILFVLISHLTGN